jgi:hypothetical protein
MAQRKYLLGSTTDFAKAQGIHPATARRQAAGGKIAGARKVGNRWYIPLNTAQYAAAKGVSQSTARRRGISASSATDRRLIQGVPPVLDGKGRIPTDRYQTSANMVTGWQYQFWAFVHFTDGDSPTHGDLFSRVVRSDVELSRAQLRRIPTPAGVLTPEQLIRMDNAPSSGSNYRPFDILRMDVIAKRRV